MNEPGPQPSPQPSRRWLIRLQALFEVILLAGILSTLVALVPFRFISGSAGSVMENARAVAAFVLLESFVTFILLYLILRAHGEHPSDLGWTLRRWRTEAMIGLAIVPALFGLNILVATLFKLFLPSFFLDHNPLLDLIRTPQDLLLFLVSALIAGGIKEEVQRAFILIRFRRHLGGALLGLILWSLVFGAGHYVQGMQGAVAATLFGLTFGALYLIRGSLLAPVVAHAAYDAVALLAFWYLRSAPAAATL